MLWGEECQWILNRGGLLLNCHFRRINVLMVEADHLKGYLSNRSVRLGQSAGHWKEKA